MNETLEHWRHRARIAEALVIRRESDIDRLEKHRDRLLAGLQSIHDRADQYASMAWVRSYAKAFLEGHR